MPRYRFEATVDKIYFVEVDAKSFKEALRYVNSKLDVWEQDPIGYYDNPRDYEYSIGEICENEDGEEEYAFALWEHLNPKLIKRL